jgi:hypothetical protein
MNTNRKRCFDIILEMNVPIMVKYRVWIDDDGETKDLNDMGKEAAHIILDKKGGSLIEVGRPQIAKGVIEKVSSYLSGTINKVFYKVFYT